MACACKGVRPSLGACSGGNGGRPSSRPSPSSLSSLTTAGGRGSGGGGGGVRSPQSPIIDWGAATCRRRLHPTDPLRPTSPTQRPTSPSRFQQQSHSPSTPPVQGVPIPSTAVPLSQCAAQHAYAYATCFPQPQSQSPQGTGGAAGFAAAAAAIAAAAAAAAAAADPTATQEETAAAAAAAVGAACASGVPGSPSSAGPCNTRGECCGSGTASHRIPAGYECSRRQWRRATCEQPSGWC